MISQRIRRLPLAGLVLIVLLAVVASIMTPLGEASQRRGQVPRSRTADSVQVPTLQAFRRLERRVQALEDFLDAEPVPPDRPTRPDKPTRPTRPDRPIRPARAPPISIVWAPRESPPTSFTFAAGAYAEEVRDGIAFRCYVDTAPGLDASMVTVAAINGHAGRGVAYFEQLQISTPTETLLDLRGRHVILPRGAILRRYYLGPDAAQLEAWDWVDDPRPVPAWAPARAQEKLGKFAAQVGPYSFHWAYHSLSDSHGGQGVAPFHGGPDDWLTCGTGRQLRVQEMLSAYQRPIWILGPTPAEPYWMGRTMAHRLQGYNEDPDAWCAYAFELNKRRAADHTHLSRTTGAAAALAPWDSFARAALLASWTDFKAANSLTRPKEASPSDHLLWPLWFKVEAADGPLNSEGDRGLAHWLRLLRWLRPYVPADELDPYQDALREWTGKMAGQYGYTRTSSPTVPAAAPLVAPYIQAFHQQLNLYEFQRFGGLQAQAKLLGAHLTPLPNWYFEARDGRPRDTALDRSHSEKTSHAAYGSMTHGVLPGFPSPAKFLEAMEFRGVNGASQDLDCTPREIWEPGLGS